MEKFLVKREKFISKKINLEKIRECVGKALEKKSVHEDDIYRMQLATDEACSNIIMHNYDEDTNRPIFISIKDLGDKVSILIEDEGDKFNPLDITDPNLDQYIEKYKKNGLGVYLMRRLVDEIRYHTAAEQGNKIELIKYLSKSK
ncbi:MAG: ATP-binding protein [Spirochaetes bacterium]|nr:ATP-binding protein [Spirochaetota bacterium]